MSAAQRYILMHDAYGRRIDQMQVAAIVHADRGDLAMFVGLSALADTIAIAEQRARKVMS